MENKYSKITNEGMLESENKHQKEKRRNKKNKEA